MKAYTIPELEEHLSQLKEKLKDDSFRDDWCRKELLKLRSMIGRSLANDEIEPEYFLCMIYVNAKDSANLAVGDADEYWMLR